MKVIYLLAMFLFIQTANGQDYCSLVKKEMLEDNKTFEFASPYNISEKPVIRVTRSFNTDPEYGYDNFFINFRLEGSIDSVYRKNEQGGQTEKNDKSLIVEFEDKSKVVDDTITINHDVSDDHTLAVWYLDFPMSENNIKDFCSKKIAKFTLAGYQQAVPADSASALMHYIQCIKAVNKRDVARKKN